MAFQQTNYPLATLFQLVVKTVEKGVDASNVSQEFLDTVTGKKYVPFAKATKITSVGNFMYAVHIFVISAQSIKKEAPSVYFQFAREMKRANDSGGFAFGQKYCDAILRGLDEGIFENLVQFFKSGEHNRIYTEMWSEHDTTVPKDLRSKDKNDPRQKIIFGPVTTPLGGKGAGVITNFKTGERTKCSRFHATPQGKCTAGIPAGDPRFTPDQVGLCAYTH